MDVKAKRYFFVFNTDLIPFRITSPVQIVQVADPSQGLNERSLNPDLSTDGLV